MRGVVRLTIPNHRPPSWNGMYAGVHWAKRKELADKVHLLVREQIDPDVPCFDGKVHITVRAYFANKPQDASNIPVKLYEDALKGFLIHDDSPEYVSGISAISLVDKKNPRVEIEITSTEPTLFEVLESSWGDIE